MTTTLSGNVSDTPRDTPEQADASMHGPDAARAVESSPQRWRMLFARPCLGLVRHPSLLLVRCHSLFVRTVISVGIWYVYVPHLTIIRLLGPTLGLRLARLTAWLHWLTTFFGTQKDLRRTLTRLYPHFDTDLPVRTLIRKHIEART